MAQNIKEKGHEERFTNLEIILLAREILRHTLSSRQLNYWFPLRKNWKQMEESSSLDLQIVNNDDKKGIEKKSHVRSQADVAGAVLLQRIKIGSEETTVSNNCSTLQSKANSTRPTSYFDLADPKSINCTNHPMY